MSAAGLSVSSRVVLPDSIELPALGETWQVLYEPMRTHVVGIISETPGVLTVYGAVDHQPACRRALLAWLKQRTREEISPFLSALAGEHGFRFKESIVRCQKTRWGSCSAKGTISLNCKLLFLERNQVRCILLHELCHTVFMNHSEKFHALLHRIEPACRQIDRQMRKARKVVPPWVEHGPEP
jgi:predicted metal-dependent hydrolase